MSLAIAVTLIANSVALAGSIDGQWVVSGYSCSKAIDGVMTVAPRSWVGNDWSCEVTQTKIGEFSRSCQVDDVFFSDVVTASVSGDTLTVTEDGTTTTYTRCPAE